MAKNPYPPALSDVFQKPPEKRNAEDIALVVEHFQSSAEELAERLTREDPDFRLDAERIALDKIRKTAQDHSEFHAAPLRQRWYQMASKSITLAVKKRAKKAAGPDQTKTKIMLDVLFRQTAALVLAHLEQSRHQEKNKQALRLLYGQNGTPLKPDQAAKKAGVTRQVLAQTENFIHRKVRDHTDYLALKSRWRKEIQPAVDAMSPLPVGSLEFLQRGRLTRLFKK